MAPISPVPVSLFGAPLEAAAPLGSGASPAAAAAALGPAPPAAPPAPFADLVVDAVGQVQQLEQQAQIAVEGLISGQGVDVHQAMIAAQKAGMGFELVLSLRNKALAAYQQVLGMQF